MPIAGRSPPPRVESIGPLLGAESIELNAAGAVQRKGPEAEFRPQIARHDVNQGGVAAVGVVEHEFLEARVRQTRAQVVEYRHEGDGAHRERSRKAEMLVTLAVMYRRQRIN